MRRVIPSGLKRALVRLLPPGNRPGHENTPAYRGGEASADGEAAARGATGSAHWEIPHSAGSRGHDRSG
jgi:hypothetical protein